MLTLLLVNQTASRLPWIERHQMVSFYKQADHIMRILEPKQYKQGTNSMNIVRDAYNMVNTICMDMQICFLV